MARNDRGDRGVSEPLSRLLARSDVVTRELERARERLAELQERFEADEPLASDDAAPGVHDPSDAPEPQEPAPPDASPDPEASLPDPNRGWLIRIPEPAEPRDEPGDEPSVDTEITLLQEAARRRLSDER